MDAQGTVRENFIRAIDRRRPAHVPLVVPDQPEISDGVMAVTLPAAGFTPAKEGATEWGFAWKRLDETVGQPEKPVLADWATVADFAPPDPDAPGRFEQLDAMRAEYPDRYALLSLGVSGFTLMSLLIGFEELLEGVLTGEPRVYDLADLVFGFEEGIIRGAAAHGAGAVCFYDDWGTQHGTIIAPTLWRDVFKPRYVRQFALAHELGMHVDFHSCGNVYALIDELIDSGADMLNLNQPRLFGIERLAADFGRRVCFLCPVDIQRVLLDGTQDEIRAEARLLIESLGKPDGGFVALVEPFYAKLAASPDNIDTAIAAFREFGRY